MSEIDKSIRELAEREARREEGKMREWLDSVPDTSVPIIYPNGSVGCLLEENIEKTREERVYEHEKRIARAVVGAALGV